MCDFRICRIAYHIAGAKAFTANRRALDLATEVVRSICISRCCRITKRNRHIAGVIPFDRTDLIISSIYEAETG